jgi:hypothetical protein
MIFLWLQKWIVESYYLLFLAGESCIRTFTIWARNMSDFWTTRCERCPEAIAKLNDYAESRKVAGDDSTLFLTVSELWY